MLVAEPILDPRSHRRAGLVRRFLPRGERLAAACPTVDPALEPSRGELLLGFLAAMWISIKAILSGLYNSPVALQAFGNYRDIGDQRKGGRDPPLSRPRQIGGMLGQSLRDNTLRRVSGQEGKFCLGPKRIA